MLPGKRILAFVAIWSVVSSRLRLGSEPATPRGAVKKLTDVKGRRSCRFYCILPYPAARGWGAPGGSVISRKTTAVALIGGGNSATSGSHPGQWGEQSSIYTPLANWTPCQFFDEAEFSRGKWRRARGVKGGEPQAARRRGLVPTAGRRVSLLYAAGHTFDEGMDRGARGAFADALEPAQSDLAGVLGHNLWAVVLPRAG